MPKGDNPKSKENLKKGNRFTKETASENGRLGALSPKRMTTRSLKLAAQEALARPVHDKHGNEMSVTDAMINILVDEAIVKRNMKAWELLRDTSGQKPVEKVEFAEIPQDAIDTVEQMIQDAQGKYAEIEQKGTDADA